ncbi:MAG: hypothetical protein IJT73_08065, partial [Selenomonadaceae bacterium]|nr:hypothetical protein [Selenomonadaceae bacterium]
KMANNFMRLANRFGNRNLNSDLSQTQLIALLALPEGEEEKFIEEKAAKGTPVENMTVKKLRLEIQQYKRDNDALNNEIQRIQSVSEENVNRADKAEAKVQSLFADIDRAQKQNSALKAENSALKNQKPITVEPADYQQLKKSKAALQSKIAELQKELNQKTVTVVTPADYESTKKELAELKAAESEMIQRMDVFQKLSTVASLIQDIIKSPSLAGIQDFKREYPEEFGKMCAAFLDFTDSFYEE